MSQRPGHGTSGRGLANMGSGDGRRAVGVPGTVRSAPSGAEQLPACGRSGASAGQRMAPPLHQHNGHLFRRPRRARWRHHRTSACSTIDARSKDVILGFIVRLRPSGWADALDFRHPARRSDRARRRRPAPTLSDAVWSIEPPRRRRQRRLQGAGRPACEQLGGRGAACADGGCVPRRHEVLAHLS